MICMRKYMEVMERVRSVSVFKKALNIAGEFVTSQRGAVDECYMCGVP